MRTPLRRYARGDELITLDEVQQNRSRVYSFDHQGTTQCLTDGTGVVTDRFAADEEQVADVIFYRDVDDILRFLEGDAAAGFGIEFGARKTAEIAIGVADVRDGELQVARTAVVEDFAHQFEQAFLRADDGLGKIDSCRTCGRRSCRLGTIGWRTGGISRCGFV